MYSVLVVTPWFPNRPGERQGNFVYESAKSLAARGVDVSILASRPYVPGWLQSHRPAWLSGRIDESAYREFSRVRQVYYPSVPGNRFWQVSMRLHDRVVGPALRSLVSIQRPDIIHAHTEGLAASAVAVARETGIPAVVTLHGINDGRRYFDDPRRRELFGKSLSAADRVILVGEPLRPFFEKVCGDTRNFLTIPNGVELPSGGYRQPERFRGETIGFISVSNLQQTKGIDIALRALAVAQSHGFRSWTYTIVGDGPERSNLNDLCRSLGLNNRVRFLGDQSRSAVFDLLNRSDAFLLPSYLEAFGIAYLEGMALGLVAVGVRDQGPSAFIESGHSGFLVQPRDVSSLADCIELIFRQPERMRSIGYRAAEVAREQFSWDEHASKLMSLYRELAH